jgi:DNA replication protein DnaC
MATQVDLAADYETIRQQLQEFNQQREMASTVDQIITRYERKTLLSAGQIRGSRYNPSPDEEKQLALDNIRQNLNDLREAARTPEFGRCFFVLGDMGSGKTHFLRVDLPQSGQSHGSPVLDLQPMPVSGRF